MIGLLLIDTACNYIPRPILSLWLMGTLIFTFILRNEILALFSARFIDKIDSIDDIGLRNLKVLVQSDSNQMSVLKTKIRLQHILPIAWTDLWTVETKEKVLSGSHVLVFNEDKLDVMVSVNPEYPLRISNEKRDLRFGYYLFRVDLNRTLERKVNKWSVRFVLDRLFLLNRSLLCVVSRYWAKLASMAT